MKIVNPYTGASNMLHMDGLEPSGLPEDGYRHSYGDPCGASGCSADTGNGAPSSLADVFA